MPMCSMGIVKPAKQHNQCHASTTANRRRKLNPKPTADEACMTQDVFRVLWQHVEVPAMLRVRRVPLGRKCTAVTLGVHVSCLH